MAPLLSVDRLTVGYRTSSGTLEAVRDISFQIRTGQMMGIVGESGSGKSTLALALMRYLPANGHIQHGSIQFQGQDLYGMEEGAIRRIWGAAMGLVPQDPLSALNPSMRIGEQILEILRRHLALDEREAETSSLEWLKRVHLSDAEAVARSFPHQLSGGMQQRVMIAMALCTEPALLIFDEPTTNLDATTQAAILDLIKELMARRKAAAIYITHNLGVVAQMCDELSVLYAGEGIEFGKTQDLFDFPLHPYTQALLDSVPRLGGNRSRLRLRAIEGRIPPLDDLPSGCLFRERCPLAVEICEQHPPLYRSGAERLSRCHRWEEISHAEVDAGQPEATFEPQSSSIHKESSTLDLQNLQVQYLRSRCLLARISKRSPGALKAVDRLNMEIQAGETMGLVGESGSGKSTVARAIVGLVIPTDGVVRLQGRQMPAKLQNRTLDQLRQVQMVFQNSSEAFNPYLTIGESLQRPLLRLLKVSKSEAADRVEELLEWVRLPASFAQRFPMTLSGGERQRAAVARAFASSPALLMADEAVSALDVSVQAAILNLLSDLQASNDSAMLFISHDLAAVGYVADRIAVLYLGQLMQIDRAESLFQPAYHPYTEALLSAIPLVDPQARQERIRLSGDIAPSTERTAGCPFEPRCPRRLGDICHEQDPPWQGAIGGNRIYCHIPMDELEKTQSKAFAFNEDGSAAR